VLSGVLGDPAVVNAEPKKRFCGLEVVFLGDDCASPQTPVVDKFFGCGAGDGCAWANEVYKRLECVPVDRDGSLREVPRSTVGKVEVKRLLECSGFCGWRAGIGEFVQAVDGPCPVPRLKRSPELRAGINPNNTITLGVCGPFAFVFTVSRVSSVKLHKSLHQWNIYGTLCQEVPVLPIKTSQLLNESIMATILGLL
jgi:hypothetical protein